MSALKKIETGVPGLDILTLGGIPEGRSTLIAGKSGTGKTVVGLQIASNLAKQGIRTIVLAVEESPEDMQDSGDGLGLGITRLVREEKLHFAHIGRPMEGPTIVAGEYDLFGLVHRIEAMAAQTGARAIILDSATALFSPRPPAEALRSHFFQLVHTLRKLGLTAVILAEAPDDYGPLTTMGVEDYVCDLTLVLRNVIDGGRRRRSIEVNKYRRSAHYKGEYPMSSSNASASGWKGTARAGVVLRQRCGARRARVDLGGGVPDCGDPVELILYVSAQSPRSFAAVRNIKKVLERFEASRVKLTVCDLSQNPNGGVEDAIAFTPTLVRRTPGPRTYILGHITNPELVLELLADCEMEQN